MTIAIFGANTTRALQSQPEPLPPSVTPLFSGPPRTSVPYGIVVPGPNAQSTLPPFSGGTAATPAVGPVTGTPPASDATPAQTPGAVTVTIPTDQIGQVISSISNTLLAFVTGGATQLWALAGQQGGWIGQLACCVLPALLALLFGWRRVIRPFRRR